MHFSFSRLAGTPASMDYARQDAEEALAALEKAPRGADLAKLEQRAKLALDGCA